MVDKFWEIKNLSQDEGELILYGNISSEKPWWDDSGEGIYARQFADDLKSLGNVQNINVRLNSNGGDVSAATAIYTQLKNHDANVTIIIDGIAASAATIIAMAGDTVKAPSNAIFMIHDPLLVLYGYYNSSDMDKMKDVLSTIKDSIVNAYMSKASCSKDELATMMQTESWMTAEEAKGYGFIDEIMFEETVDTSVTNDGRFMVVNSIAFDMSEFKTRPTIPSKVSNKVKNTLKGKQLPPVAATKNQGVEGEEELEIKNVEDLKKSFPDLCNELVTKAVNKAQQDERERLKAIDEISATVDQELVAKAKYEQPMSAKDLAFESLKTDASKGKTFHNQRQQELNPANKVGTAINPEINDGDDAEFVNKIAASANQKRSKGGK